jgi:hypothetical protein
VGASHAGSSENVVFYGGANLGWRVGGGQKNIEKCPTYISNKFSRTLNNNSFVQSMPFAGFLPDTASVISFCRFCRT